MKMNFSIKTIILGLSFLLIISCAIELPLEEQVTWYEARVAAIIDGDTIQIQFIDDSIPGGCERSERVRLIGVDTPELFTEPPEFFAQEAKDFSNELYLTNVLLEFDPISARRDRYGRLLAYIYKDFGSISINEQLITEGFGYYYGIFAFDPERMTEFQNTENYARSNHKGLWK